MPHKKHSKYISKEVNEIEIVDSLSKILKIEKKIIVDNIWLFSNMDSYYKNIFYYLAQIEKHKRLVDALYVLELLLNFHKNKHK